MEIDELKQLEEDVCAWWAAWCAYKCKTSERHYYMAIQRRHIENLIDAEIQRQSVTEIPKTKETWYVTPDCPYGPKCTDWAPNKICMNCRKKLVE